MFKQTGPLLLVVEVADTTLTFDLDTKVPLYARTGIPEVWVVDLPKRAVLVYRDPLADSYKTTFTATGEEIVSAAALPEVRFAVRDLFPR